MLAYTATRLAACSSQCSTFFLFFIWIWILFTVFVGALPEDRDLNGWLKALWVIFVIVLPYLGVFVYLIARGGKMQERKLQEASHQQKSAFDPIRQRGCRNVGR